MTYHIELTDFERGFLSSLLQEESWSDAARTDNKSVGAEREKAANYAALSSTLLYKVISAKKS